MACMQPRVGIAVHSVARSRLAAIYSGQTGFDIYTRAISDVYQDLYGEGIFTGKGLYEIQILHEVLDRRFPQNSLLSHDLIEGAYARVGLLTDVEVMDDYPSHYSAQNRRKHRWVRGDWQILRWLLGRVPNDAGQLVQNPTSNISRWKIFDNLRRSLVEPATFLLLVAGWLWLPGSARYWTLATLLIVIVPVVVQFLFSLVRASVAEQRGYVRQAIRDSLVLLFSTALNFALLAHQTLLMFDAIVRSLVRSFVTGRRLLEWETAAEAEIGTGKRTPVEITMGLVPLLCAVLLILVVSDTSVGAFLGVAHSDFVVARQAHHVVAESIYAHGAESFRFRQVDSCVMLHGVPGVISRSMPPMLITDWCRTMFRKKETARPCVSRRPTPDCN